MGGDPRTLPRLVVQAQGVLRRTATENPEAGLEGISGAGSVGQQVVVHRRLDALGMVGHVARDSCMVCGKDLLHRQLHLWGLLVLTDFLLFLAEETNYARHAAAPFLFLFLFSEQLLCVWSGVAARY